MFACKNCGGNVKFDIKSGQLACEYCHSLFDPYAYEDKTSDAEVQKDFEATIFTCPQCGGEILSTDDTAAGFCSFCGASSDGFHITTQLTASGSIFLNSSVDLAATRSSSSLLVAL